MSTTFYVEMYIIKCEKKVILLLLTIYIEQKVITSKCSCSGNLYIVASTRSIFLCKL